MRQDKLEEQVNHILNYALVDEQLGALLSLIETERKEAVKGFVLKKQKVIKYTTHLTQKVIKELKRYALDNDLKDYEVMQDAIDRFLEKMYMEDK